MKTLGIFGSSLFMIISTAQANSLIFECIGQHSQYYYDFTIVDNDAGEGLVTVNNGGAPTDFMAAQRQTDDHRYLFEFGFDNYDSGIIPRLSFAEIFVSRENLATGLIEYFEHDYDSQSHQLIREQISCSIQALLPTIYGSEL